MKSLHARLSEVLEKLTSKQRDKFYESRKSGDPIEVQVNCAEAILAGKVKESNPITKHNGAGDNGRVTEFTESGNSRITETAKSDAILYKGLGISEADQRRLNGLPPAGESLTANQLREYRFLRSIRLSESDALKGARRVA